MAMAQVFLPDIPNEDHLPSFPRAPPPSPEMQPRSHNHVFEIPASKFEGMGLDLRRDTFPLDEDEESPLDLHHLSAIGCAEERNSPVIFTRELDEEDVRSFPSSPQKRVCCTPGTLPVDLTTTAFPSSNHSSLVSSGFGSFGSYQNPLHDTIPEEGSTAGGGVGSTTLGFMNHTGSHSQSNSPPRFGSRTSPEAGSHLAARRSGAGAAFLTTPILQPPTLPEHAPLSRSYDFHNMHPHLPLSFETTQLPEVRPTRSRTLDATSSPTHDIRRARSHTLDAEEMVERKRKVSIKRKNPDETDGDDPSLQFSFEYSYSSTGSGGDPDWVMVDCKVESSRPMEKKACCVNDLAITSRQDLGSVSLLNTSPLQGMAFSAFGDGRAEREGRFTPSLQQNPLELQPVGVSPFSPTPHFAGQPGMGVVSERVATPTEQPISMESMDCEGRMDSLDQMECETENQGVISNHLQMSTLYQPMLTIEQTSGLVMRPHPQQRAGAVPLPLRRSCVEEYLQPSQNHRGQGFGVGVGGVSMDSDLDAKLNLSKSL